MTDVYTPDTLAKRWSCSVHTVRNLIHDGKVRAFRVGHALRISAKEVERFEAATEDAPASPFDLMALRA